ncbi:hypothetical protein ACFE04_012795 [Oxalis oulophora]
MYPSSSEFVRPTATGSMKKIVLLLNYDITLTPIVDDLHLANNLYVKESRLFYKKHSSAIRVFKRNSADSLKKLFIFLDYDDENSSPQHSKTLSNHCYKRGGEAENGHGLDMWVASSRENTSPPKLREFLQTIDDALLCRSDCQN